MDISGKTAIVARWRDRWVMQLPVISAPTTAADISRSCEAICKAWQSVTRSNLAGDAHF
jgi:hypothetical protein